MSQGENRRVSDGTLVSVFVGFAARRVTCVSKKSCKTIEVFFVTVRLVREVSLRNGFCVLESYRCLSKFAVSWSPVAVSKGSSTEECLSARFADNFFFFGADSIGSSSRAPPARALNK